MADTTLAKWYAAHTYSGYEKKVKADIEMTIENRGLQEKILEVSVPEYDEEEMTERGSRTVKKKLFPGYVLVHMVMDEETWYIVRNTRGVTGFVGPGSKPEPLTEEEVIRIGLMAPENALFEVGDKVEVTSGAWKGSVGDVKTVNAGKREVQISLNVFGRETTITLGFECLKVLD
ncbi:MAG: transcription termination/antitermination factor NusG [Lachnospiraceae bacterium]|jgi:transcriptional antiterminator NusG|nr:transcription termination/antitermination factor NusG [Lachnospiraceae bacterium]MBQ3967663.1 transcription termination/antitermination factor NusG [Lachnospiraceae bacterium]MBR4587784.1 transcription termination/antitermination factor NusG [Lachnospiraceae bacterium]MCR4927560.1 transcription termination/antitermination protein NusG [Lachnospiraceae bacterium]